MHAKSNFDEAATAYNQLQHLARTPEAWNDFPHIWNSSSIIFAVTLYRTGIQGCCARYNLNSLGNNSTRVSCLRSRDPKNQLRFVWSPRSAGNGSTAVWLPTLPVDSGTGIIFSHCPRSGLRIRSRETGLVVPSRTSLLALHKQEPGS